MNKRQVYKKRIASVYKNRSDAYSNSSFVKDRLQSDGTVKIDVELPTDFPLFDPLAPTKYGIVNPEIFRYVDDQVYFVPAEYDITVNFVGREFSPQEQKQIDKAVHDHYNLQVYDKLDDIKRNRRLGIFLLIFGVLALALYFVLTFRSDNPITLELISIVGTFSVWEAVDCWLIQGFERRQELNNALQTAQIKVTFGEAENNANGQ